MTAVATASGAGRTRIAPRAIDRVVSAVTAEALGVRPGTVDVDLSDDAGALRLDITTRIRVPALDRVVADATVVDRAGGPLSVRADDAHETIRRRVTELTGSRIGRISLRVSDAVILPPRRVR